VKSSRIRAKIVNTASDLFYRQGYNRTGINEIIREADIAKATLYSHFRSKEDLCLAYLSYRHDSFMKDIKRTMGEAEAGKPTFIALFDFLASFYKQKDFNGCWCIKTVAEIPMGDSRIRTEIQRQKKELVTYLDNLLAEYYPSMDWVTRRSTARQIYLLYESAVAESQLHREAWPIEEARELCDRMLG